MNSSIPQTDAHYVSEVDFIAGIFRLLDAGRVEEASTIYGRSQTDVGFPLIHQAKANPARLKQVASLLFLARDFEKAAECCEHLGELDKAGQLYEQAGCYDLAADLYSRCGKRKCAAGMLEKMHRHHEAAQLYQLDGDPERAAECLLHLQRYVEAGQLFRDAGKPARAMEAWQNVPVQSPDGVAAKTSLAVMLREAGHLTHAMHVTQEAIERRGLSEETAPLIEELAWCYLESGQPEHAKTVIDKLAELSPSTTGLTALRAKLSSDSQGRAIVGTCSDDVIPVVPTRPPETDHIREPTLLNLDTGLEFLAAQPLFAGLSLTELRAIFHLCQVESFTPGQVIVARGHVADALWLFQTGEVEVRDPATSVSLATLGPGELIGEMSLVDEVPSNVDVVGTVSGKALRLDRDGLEQALRRSDTLAARVFRVLSVHLAKKLRVANTKRVVDSTT